jgi:hypothetical protein
MNILYLLTPFVICAAIGFFLVIRATRGLRVARNYGDVLLAWTEPPRVDLHADLPTWLGINLHRGTAIGLGIAELLVILGRPKPDAWSTMAGSWAVWALSLLMPAAVALMGLLWGFVLGGPLAERIGGDHHYAVAEQGILAHGRLLPWSTFREVSVGAASGLIYLWSRPLAGAVAFVFRPPSAELRQQLLSILQIRLPLQAERPGLLRRYSFPLLMAAFCTPFIAAAIVLCIVGGTAALLTLPLLLWLLLGAGSLLIMRAIYGGEGRPAATAAA